MLVPTSLPIDHQASQSYVTSHPLFNATLYTLNSNLSVYVTNALILQEKIQDLILEYAISKIHVMKAFST